MNVHTCSFFMRQNLSVRYVDHPSDCFLGKLIFAQTHTATNVYTWIKTSIILCNVPVHVRLQYIIPE